MNCPKCNQPMKLGFLPVYRGRLYWAPEPERVPLLINIKPKGSIVLSDYTLSLPLKAEAHYCTTCKMVIMHEKNRETSDDFTENPFI
ncbi:MAG: PF20097 family protein [Acholeplasma sp.]|nr:PF20097 family protein [Acholeplasma sp.]